MFSIGKSAKLFPIMQQKHCHFLKKNYFCAKIEQIFLMRHFSVILTFFLVLAYLDICGQNKRVLLLETFTNSGCETCAQQIPELDALITVNSDKIAAIQYHVNWPSSSDSMYLHNPAANTARMEYYGVTGVPHVVIDGNHFSGTPHQLNQDIIDLLLATESPIEMQLDFEIDGVSNTLSAHVTGQSATTASDIRLYVGIIEKEVHFDSILPDSNGEHDFYNVMHALLPNAYGQAIEHLAANEPFDYTFTYNIVNPDNLEQLDAIAWIQAFGSKTVLQACKAKNSHSLSETIYPNPTTGMVSIISSTPQKVSVFNMSGQCIYERCCHNILCLNLGDFGTGLFIIKVGSLFQKVIVK